MAIHITYLITSNHGMNKCFFQNPYSETSCTYLLTSCLSKWGETSNKVSSSAAPILHIEELFNPRNAGCFTEYMVQSVKRKYQLYVWLIQIKLTHIYAYWALFSSWRLSLGLPNLVIPASMLSLFSICVKNMRFIYLY